ncbi:MAG TPA: hypothetical protein VN808_13675 [Stellaceae bacterium]|nr:hypothetical protein [Stellaceae bacterium]
MAKKQAMQSASRTPRAQRPGDDNLVADIPVNFASRGKHRVGDVKKYLIEETVEILVTEPLGMAGRVVEIEK